MEHPVPSHPQVWGACVAYRRPWRRAPDAVPYALFLGNEFVIAATWDLHRDALLG